MQHEGAEVAVVRSAPDPGGDQRVLVLQDRLNDGQRRDLLAFVEAGGVVVMADPLSSLAGDIGPVATVTDELPAFDGNELAGQINIPLDRCDVAALAHLRGVFVRTGVRFRDTASQACFRDESGSFAVVHQRGEGLIVQLGDNELFTNAAALRRQRPTGHSAPGARRRFAGRRAAGRGGGEDHCRHRLR